MPIADFEARAVASQCLAAASSFINDPANPMDFEVAPIMATGRILMTAKSPGGDREFSVLVMVAVSESAPTLAALSKAISGHLSD